MKKFAMFLCPSVLLARHIGHNRNRSPTIARALSGPCRPHKECKDAGEDVIFLHIFIFLM
jgi:hypothetical protein